MHGYGMPGTQIIWNRWGRTMHQYLAQKGCIVFAMDTRGMSGRGEKFKNLEQLRKITRVDWDEVFKNDLIYLQ